MKHSSLATLAQLGDFDEIIDVRSPAEFALDHVPGAINCPVLDDAERARVGTLYKQVSAFEASRVGAALVARNIARHLEDCFADRPREWRPLVYCWRGGKRSGAMTLILNQIGWRAAQLEGGYKVYRHDVNQQLASLPSGMRFRIIAGPTGSGKSVLLQALHTSGAQVLDLEDLARHKGSVLGVLPHAAQPSQKMFDSLILHVLRQFDPAQPVFVESESKKVGGLRVPPALIEAMRLAPCVLVEAPLDARVNYLLRDYRHFIDQPSLLLEPLQRLTELHGKEQWRAWVSMVEAGEWPEFVESLLVKHYDPAYHRSMGRNFSQLAEALALRLASLEPAAVQQAAEQLLSDTRQTQASHSKP